MFMMFVARNHCGGDTSVQVAMIGHELRDGITWWELETCAIGAALCPNERGIALIVCRDLEFHRQV